MRGNVGFTGRDLVRLGCSVTELRKAGFDDAKSLRRLGCSAIELKEKGFTPKELWSGGDSLRELVAAGVTGQALRALGCSIDDLLGNVWETQGAQAYLDQLCQVCELEFQRKLLKVTIIALVSLLTTGRLGVELHHRARRERN